MHETILATAARLSDDAILARMPLHVGREREASLRSSRTLPSFSGGPRYLGEGWGPLFSYCRDCLHLSGDAAYNRVAAARAVRLFPVILDHLAAGFVTVTTVKTLRPVLTTQNHLAVLAEAKHRSKLEVERIVARLEPRPDVPSTIRKLPPPAPAGLSVPGLVKPEPEPKQPEQEDAPAPRPREVLPSPVRRPVVAPLAPARYRVQFTIPEETHDKLRHVQELLCREVPDGDPAAIFDRALDALLHEVEKKKLAATTAPRAARGTRNGSRAIPAHVRRAVWKRDGGRCAFEVGKAGARSDGTSSGITSSPTATKVQRRSRTSLSAAAPTTSTKASWSSAVSIHPSCPRRPRTTLLPGKSRRSRTAPRPTRRRRSLND